MVDNWNDYAKKREQEKQKQETITKDSPVEWIALTGFAQSLADDGKGVEDQKFQWIPDAYSPCLVLGYVAAYFEYREKDRKIESCRVRFDLRPLGPREIYVSDKPPFLPVEWALEPTLGAEGIEWMIVHVNVAMNKKVSFSSSDLAGKVGIKLAELLDAYKRHFSLGSTA